MQIIATDEHFIYKDISYPELPILIDSSLEIVKPVFQFMIYIAIQDARIQSPRTIKSYASCLYDYFSFLEANEIQWHEPYLNDSDNFSLSALALYRNWSVTLKNDDGSRSVSDSTINLRLSVLKRFYEYCYATGLIAFEPWETLFKVQPENGVSFLRHTRGQKIVKSNDLVLKAYKKPPKLLSLEQCKSLISEIDSVGFKLMTKLMLSAGLRKDEIISFEKRFIHEPDLRNVNKRIPIDLEPRVDGQRTKGTKPRRIYISTPLMRELWDYLNFGERVLRGQKHTQIMRYHSPFAFLNRFGKPYSEQSLNNFYNKLHHQEKIDFKVSPHMLRHTYATIELYAESERIGMTKALAWVQKRMGHSSIATTSIYIHCIELLHEHELSTYQAELDKMV